MALARALVKRPQLLLLDEPLSNLDATLRLTMRAEIKSLQRQLGVTSILVTHDQLEATTMADRIICMRQGRIEQIGTPDDLYLPPAAACSSRASSARRRSTSCRARSRATGCASTARALPTTGEAGGAVVLGHPARGAALRRRAASPARITEVEPMGRETLYLVESDLGTLRVLEAGSLGAARVSATR